MHCHFFVSPAKFSDLRFYRQKLLEQDHNEMIYKMLIEDAHSVRSAAAAFTDVAYLDGVLTPLYEEEASSKCHDCLLSWLTYNYFRNNSLSPAEGRSLNKGEMLLKGLIEMVTTVIGAEIGDEAVYQMVEALLPHVPSLQVGKGTQRFRLKASF